jgi:anaerobic magnesium-protoporphyrin IX monomethyl ester cyclase
MSLRVAFINPDTNRRKTHGWMHRFSEAVPPLNLAYLAAVARDEGHSPLVYDQFATRQDDQDLVQALVDQGVDVLGISVLTPTVARAARISSMVKARRPDCLVVMGNTHPSVFPEETLRTGGADIVVDGEGEETFRAILKAHAAGESLGGIPGSATLVDGHYVKGPTRPAMADLSQNPFPAWEYVDLDRYWGALLLGVRGKILPLQQSRGCAYRCTFCGQESMHLKVRRRPIAHVVDEIEYLHRQFGVDFVGFEDAYFPVTKRDGLEFCDEMMKRGLHKKVRWITETRVDKVDDELLAAMKASGCHTIMYGFEVGDQGILDSLDKRTTVAQNLEAMRLTKRHDMLTLGLFIIGLPGETPQTIEATIQHAIALDCDIAKFNVATPQPGSRFYDDLLPDRPDWIDAAPEKFSPWYDGGEDDEILYAPDGMTSEQVLKLQRQAMLRFYLRPRLILRHLRRRTVAPSTLALGGLVLASNGLKTLIPDRG